VQTDTGRFYPMKTKSILVMTEIKLNRIAKK